MHTDTINCAGGIEFCVLLTPDDIRAANVLWPVPVEALSASGRLIRAILEYDDGKTIAKGGQHATATTESLSRGEPVLENLPPPGPVRTGDK